jgi:predicted oxidoreductase
LSPFQKGLFDGVLIGYRDNFGPLNDALDEITSAHGVTPTGITVAWITRHPANMPSGAGHDQARASSGVRRWL